MISEKKEVVFWRSELEEWRSRNTPGPSEENTTYLQLFVNPFLPFDCCWNMGMADMGRGRNGVDGGGWFGTYLPLVLGHVVMAVGEGDVGHTGYRTPRSRHARGKRDIAKNSMGLSRQIEWDKTGGRWVA